MEHRQLLQFGDMPYATMSGLAPANRSMVYCSDCNNTCTASTIAVSRLRYTNVATTATVFVTLVYDPGPYVSGSAY